MSLLAVVNPHSLAFLFFALLACGFALAVVLTSNIVRMAFYLTLSLGATSGLFFLAGAEFVGAMQLLIYVGGTLVLLIFGVMLTAQARFISMKTSGAEWVMAAAVGSMLFLLLLYAGFNVESWNKPRADLSTLSIFDARTSTPIGLALSGVRVDQLDEPSEQLRRGMSGYLFPFVIISVHLLVVLIGAGYMARTKRFAGRLAMEQQLVAAPRARRPRSFAVMGGIASGIVVNLSLSVLCFAFWFSPAAKAEEQGGMIEFLGQAAAYLEPASDWLCPVLGLLFLASVLMLTVIYGWQKWGVIGLVLVTILQALALGNSGLNPLVAWLFLVIAMAPVALLIGLLCSGPRPTVWEQMD
jgi:NADH:ubiquinone oxidoreductase subunit 6 (subunit J)